MLTQAMSHLLSNEGIFSPHIAYKTEQYVQTMLFWQPKARRFQPVAGTRALI
jgi:hypothetical protein